MKRTLFCCLSVFTTGLVADAMPINRSPVSSRDSSVGTNLVVQQATQLPSPTLVALPKVMFSFETPVAPIKGMLPSPFITPGKEVQISVPETGATFTFFVTSLIGLAAFRRHASGK